MKKHKLLLNLKPDTTNHFFAGVGFVEDPVLGKGKAGSQMFPVTLLSAIMGSACNKPPAFREEVTSSSARNLLFLVRLPSSTT
jgi:hypothetical protein